MTTEELALQEYEKVGDDKLFPNHTDKDIWINGFKAAVEYLGYYDEDIDELQKEINLWH